MAEPLQLRRGSKAWWDANSTVILRDGEPGYEKNLVDGEWMYSQHKMGDGVHTWAELPYLGVGPQGEQGIQGVFTSIESKEGTIAGSLTIPLAGQAGVFTNVIASTGKGWVTGDYIQISRVADLDDYMIGQVVSYNPSTGALSFNVGIDGHTDGGSYSNWTIVYAPGARSLKTHADDHQSGGLDEIPVANNVKSGLLSAAKSRLLDAIQISGISAGEVVPLDLPEGHLFVNTSQAVTYPPAITLLPYNEEGNYNYYTMQGSGLTIDIPVRLSKYMGDVNAIVLELVTGNGGIVPQNSILPPTGNNAERFLHISNDNLSQGTVTLTLYATCADGHVTSLPINFHVVNEVRVITATTEYHPDNLVSYNGVISPSGSVTVPNGGSITFTGVGDPNYGVDAMRIDGGEWVDMEGYTFTNVTAAHSIAARFNATYNFKVYQSAGNGAISPTGVPVVGQTYGLLPCVIGRQKEFTFLPAPGKKIISYWFGSSNIPVEDNVGTPFLVSLQVGSGETVVSGVWDNLDWDVIIGTHPNSTITPSDNTVGNDMGITVTFTPAQYYELVSATATIGIATTTLTGVQGWNINGCTLPILGITDDVTLSCNTRIQVPLQITNFVVTPTGTGNDIDLAWTHDPRVLNYTVKFSTNVADSADVIKETGTELTQVNPTTTGCSSTEQLVEGTTYYFVVYGTNTTGSGPSSAKVSASPTTNTLPQVNALSWVKVAI